MEAKRVCSIRDGGLCGLFSRNETKGIFLAMMLARPGGKNISLTTDHGEASVEKRMRVRLASQTGDAE